MLAPFIVSCMRSILLNFVCLHALNIIACISVCQILGHMRIDPQSLMLVTVIQNLQKLGYVFKVSHLHFLYDIILTSSLDVDAALFKTQA